MKLHITPETRAIEIPDETTAEYLTEWLAKTGLKLFHKDGKVWVAPQYAHDRIRVGDMLAAFQNHPELGYTHSHQTAKGFVSQAEDSHYIYRMEVIEK